MKAYYIKYRKEFRILAILFFLMIQGAIVNYFLGETNSGRNSAETDAVIIFKTTLILIFSICLLIPFSFYFEKSRKWRLIFIATILTIPTIWGLLILYTRNPLYAY